MTAIITFVCVLHACHIIIKELAAPKRFKLDNIPTFFFFLVDVSSPGLE